LLDDDNFLFVVNWCAHTWSFLLLMNPKINCLTIENATWQLLS
jgi:hypothetical protein